LSELKTFFEARDGGKDYCLKMEEIGIKRALKIDELGWR